MLITDTMLASHSMSDILEKNRDLAINRENLIADNQTVIILIINPYTFFLVFILDYTPWSVQTKKAVRNF